MDAVRSTSGHVVDRRKAIQSYWDNRARTQTLFDLLEPSTYYERPIPLRHPVVFYEGHIPAFSVNCFLKKGLGHPGLDSDLEALFARGIDPADRQAADESIISRWPDRASVQVYTRAADQAVVDALESATVECGENPVLCRGQGVFTMLEHEVMHQETLLYMWHRFPVGRKRRPAGVSPVIIGSVPERCVVRIPAGRATLGADIEEVRFGWDNEFPCQVVDVTAFEIDTHNVTNQDYLEFVDAGGYSKAEWWSPSAWEQKSIAGLEHPIFWERQDKRWLWRGMFEFISLPVSWPVYVTHAEASAYARWKGLRLPTEAEFHRAAYGTPEGTERPHPWGDAVPDDTHGNFGLRRFDPVPVGSHQAGASAWGIQDLVGNGWEWTSTVFDGFPGFKTMASYPEYSADFFDGGHYVVKGASSATGTNLIRRSFRNWFRPNYPYAYATFRCARDAQ